MRNLQRRVLHLLELPGARRSLGVLRRGIGTVFMLHRLADPETGAVGADPRELRRTLEFLRKRGYRLVSIQELFEALRNGDPSTDLGAAFTLDDGYREQATVAGPIFAEFDCPATVFVTTGFLDGDLWQWWDKIEHLFRTSPRRALSIEFAGAGLQYSLSTEAERQAARDDFTARCKRVPEAEKLAAIARLAAQADVELPLRAPEEYQAMTWEDVRAWEGRGLSFGAHTKTHPILSNTGDAQCAEEILGSLARLRQQARQPSPVFCYPNGGPEDVGPREYRHVQEAGFSGALTTSIGYASAREFRSRPENPYLVRRFPYPEDSRVAALFASGADRLRRGLGESR